MEKMFDLDVQVQSTKSAGTVNAAWTTSCFCSIGTDSSCWLNQM
ncbi:FDLD family class I lanthipeptide [Tumebacillus sp. ITR2]|uniref:FDLD family class I lanthipeptide n=1 Tax=Tumebacillus amylolyticus TaxID=2801339 RepID=A0ABS1J5U6_9BACL|nr:FDLD family class I lanthipeptide [Tumebacillus amylolyticus]MBL0385651.1 FDLD family class I lanthipeptide [Tumebacillus amylolyticus]